MHRDQAMIADFNAAMAVNHSVWPNENIHAELDGATVGIENYALFQACARCDRDAPPFSRPHSPLAPNGRSEMQRCVDRSTEEAQSGATEKPEKDS
jgi:hypothetical protein